MYYVFFFWFPAHVRTGSAGSLDLESSTSCDEDMRCIRLNTTKAHQQPITVLDTEGGRVLTGSQDHTLKVSFSIVGI